MSAHRRIGAMYALGAALLAFPAGVTIGISGTLGWTAAQPAPVTTAAPQERRRVGLFGEVDPRIERLTKAAEERQRQYLDAYFLAVALERELRRVKPDGHKRAQRVIEAEMARREAKKEQIKSLFGGGTP